VQLAAAIEERLGMSPESGLLEEVRTLGELRELVAGGVSSDFSTLPDSKAAVAPSTAHGSATDGSAQVFSGSVQDLLGELPAKVTTSYGEEESRQTGRAIYPHWPWSRPFHWLRVAFIEAVERPLVWLLAHPKVVLWSQGSATEPMLIVANHVTTYDGPLIQYALAGPVRRRLAVAMSGEMLEDFRHFRNPNRGPGDGKFSPLGPLAYLALTALFNVFPLPRRQNFQRSFTHAGEALDRGFNVLIFPEGKRSAEGELARFRGGIGLLARQSCAPVLPVALVGLGELKAGGKGWFRSGKIEVRVGEPICFGLEETEAAITARLHAEVEKLLSRTGG
jgi:long-chain acyl-CoA synthetase